MLSLVLSKHLLFSVSRSSIYLIVPLNFLGNIRFVLMRFFI